MAIRRQWSEEERRGLLAAHAQSGVSLWTFAQTAGIGYTTIARWKERGDGRDAAPRLLPVQIEQPVAPTSPTSPTSPAATTGARAVEVVVGDAVVRLGADFDDAVLLRVMRVLRAC